MDDNLHPEEPSGGDTDDEWRVPWSIADAVVAILISGGVLFLVALVGGLLLGVTHILDPGIERELARFIPVATTLVGYAIFVLVVFAIAIWIRRGSYADLGFRKFNVLSAIGQAVLWLIITRILTAVYLAIIIRLGFKQPVDQAEKIIRLFGKGFLGLFLAVLVAVVVAPLVEELLFRGLVYPPFRRTMGRYWAIFINGIIFGVVHLDLYLFVPLAIIGFALAWLYERSRSLGPPIALHALNNLVSIGFLYALAGGLS